MNPLKAQVSIEFLTYSILFLIAMGSMLSIIVLFGGDQLNLQRSNVIKGMAKELASSVLFAYSMSPNFQYKLKIDKELNGRPYKIYFIRNPSLSAGSIMVEQGDYAYSITTPPITYQISSPGPGIKTISNGLEISPDLSTDGFIVFESSPTPGNLKVSLE